MASTYTDPAKDARCYAAWVAGTESLGTIAQREGYGSGWSVGKAARRHAKAHRLPPLRRRGFNVKLSPEADREALALWRESKGTARETWAKKWGVCPTSFYHAWRRAKRAEEPRDPKTGPTLPRLRRCCGTVFNARNPCPRCGDRLPE